MYWRIKANRKNDNKAETVVSYCQKLVKASTVLEAIDVFNQQFLHYFIISIELVE